MKNILLVLTLILACNTIHAAPESITLKDKYSQFSFKTADYENLFWIYKKYYWNWYELKLNEDEAAKLKEKYEIEEKEVKWVNRAFIRNFLTDEVAPTIDQTWTWSKMMLWEDWKVYFENNVYQNRKLDVALAARMLEKALKEDVTDINLPITETDPKLIIDPKIKAMWIDGILSVAKSDFSRSSVSRIKNITVAFGKFAWKIIQPWETFSFNKNLGYVNARTWFVRELVIKWWTTSKEYWWWVCQVSTTMYRTAMAAGLNIHTRRNHSFSVFHYDPQWSDATIYIWWQDFKYTNDYSTPIIVQWVLDYETEIARFVFYWNKNEKRKVNLFGPYFSNYTNPLPPVYRNTTSLSPWRKIMTQRWQRWFTSTWYRIIDKQDIEPIYSRYKPIASYYSIWVWA